MIMFDKYLCSRFRSVSRLVAITPAATVSRSAWKPMPDHLFWSVRQSLKAQMLHLVRHRVARQHFRNQGSEAHLDRLLRNADPINPNMLTWVSRGDSRPTSARRCCSRISTGCVRFFGDEAKPVLFIFAGKAHPADVPRQDVIRELNRIARMPEFEDKILLLEDYDLHLARRLVSGVTSG